ncbi:hypothetical protein AB0945_08870 [Streptomyces sp. NPDC005474]|uniref:hypothetical protein n=1 Tax=Streptomyces sp. NPDC005474 TaxID=3154878 RepID=UPI003454E8D1
MKLRHSAAGAGGLAVLVLAAVTVTAAPASARPSGINDTFTLSVNSDSSPSGGGSTSTRSLDTDYNGWADAAAITDANLTALGIPTNTRPGNFPPMLVRNNNTGATTTIASVLPKGGSHPRYTIGRYRDEL